MIMKWLWKWLWTSLYNVYVCVHESLCGHMISFSWVNSLTRNGWLIRQVYIQIFKKLTNLMLLSTAHSVPVVSQPLHPCPSLHGEVLGACQTTALQDCRHHPVSLGGHKALDIAKRDARPDAHEGDVLGLQATEGHLQCCLPPDDGRDSHPYWDPHHPRCWGVVVQL